jgi:hypothetical protein
VRFCERGWARTTDPLLKRNDGKFSKRHTVNLRQESMKVKSVRIAADTCSPLAFPPQPRWRHRSAPGMVATFMPTTFLMLSFHLIFVFP